MKEKKHLVNEITNFLKQQVINNTQVEIGKDEPIIKKGLIDSMGIVRLTTHLQSLYHIEEIQHSDMVLDNFSTIDRIASMILNYIQRENQHHPIHA